MSRSKDGSNKLHEKHQMILADLLRDEDNKYCADCMAKGILPSSSSGASNIRLCLGGLSVNITSCQLSDVFKPVTCIWTCHLAYI